MTQYQETKTTRVESDDDLDEYGNKKVHDEDANEAKGAAAGAVAGGLAGAAVGGPVGAAVGGAIGAAGGAIAGEATEGPTRPAQVPVGPRGRSVELPLAARSPDLREPWSVEPLVRPGEPALATRPRRRSRTRTTTSPRILRATRAR